jgi:hypothetical protein
MTHVTLDSGAITYSMILRKFEMKKGKVGAKTRKLFWTDI